MHHISQLRFFSFSNLELQQQSRSCSSSTRGLKTKSSEESLQSRARGSEGLGTCHIIETLSVVCSPIRRFESELSTTALTGYAARDLQPLSLEGARSLSGLLLTLLPGSKRRTCALWVLLIVKAMNWLFCAGWTKRRSSMRHNQILSKQQEEALGRWTDAVSNFLEVDVGEELLSSVQQNLKERVVGYGGAVAEHALDLEAELVIAAWPDSAVTGILQVEDYIDGELLGDLQEPARCFRPRQVWPSEPRCRVSTPPIPSGSRSPLRVWH